MRSVKALLAGLTLLATSMLAGAITPPPSGPLGVALLAAYVSSSGTLIADSGATGVVKLGSTGQYEVDFNQDVSGCFYNAVSFTSTVAVQVEPRFSNPNGVFVDFETLGTTAANHVPADSEFYMTVYCGR